MSDQFDNPVLAMLLGLDAKMDRLVDEEAELKQRVVFMEEGIAGLRRDVARLHGCCASARGSLDRIEECVGRIERRLGLPEYAA